MKLKHSRHNDKNKNLRNKLMEYPQSKSLLQGLDVKATQRLISDIGKEDSCELLLQLKDDQFLKVMEDELWRVGNSGRDEIDISEFKLWLEVWFEYDEAYAVRRLILLGKDLVSLCFNRIMEVKDIEDSFESDSDGGVVFANYLVKVNFDISSDLDGVDELIVRVLAALWHSEPDYLLSILTQICVNRSPTDTETPAFLDEIDSAGRREDQKEHEGYVTYSHAIGFFEIIDGSDLQSLISKTQYDLHTKTLLKKMVAPADVIARKNIPPEYFVDCASENITDILYDLKLALIEAGVVQNDLNYLLPRKSGKASLAIENALRKLAHENPDLAEWRQMELAYLGNCMMTRFEAKSRELWARNQVLGLCNFSISYRLCIVDSELRNESEFYNNHINKPNEPGLIADFQVAWKIIQSLPIVALDYFKRQLKILLEGKGSYVDLWTRNEIEKIYYRADLESALQNKEYLKIHDVIDFASIELDPQICAILKLLINDYPKFPQVLSTARPNTNTYRYKVEKSAISFRHVLQLKAVLDFLGD